MGQRGSHRFGARVLALTQLLPWARGEVNWDRRELVWTVWFNSHPFVAERVIFASLSHASRAAQACRGTNASLSGMSAPCRRCRSCGKTDRPESPSCDFFDAI